MTDGGNHADRNVDSPIHSLIASDRVEGTPVRRSGGEKIGTVERHMIDKLSGNVAYAVLSFGGFLGMEQKHLPIPWARRRQAEFNVN
jgi:PRC-barrel domain protein